MVGSDLETIQVGRLKEMVGAVDERQESEYTDITRCVLNTFLVACQLGISVVFMVLLYSGQNRSAGYLEWTLSYLGSFWLMSFIGYTK